MSAAQTQAVSAGTVIASRDEDVLTLTLSHPGKRNALTTAMYEQLAAYVAEAATDATLRAVVLRGDPDGGFAAGTDIATFIGFDGSTDGLAYERRVGAVLTALQELPVPTIAVVRGAAVGAGLAIVASCDLILAERGAVFGAPIARTLGNCLPAAVVQRISSRMGTARALAMLLTASLVPAEDLIASGFVTRLTEPAELDDTVDSVLRGIRRSAPLTLRALKETVRRIEAAAPADNDDLLELCYGSADFAEGVNAFLGKRHPHWKGNP
jgi:enoyl-CoA hydratase/carnithine racemase